VGKNIGSVDKTIRMLAGIGLIVWALPGSMGVSGPQLGTPSGWSQLWSEWYCWPPGCCTFVRCSKYSGSVHTEPDKQLSFANTEEFGILLASREVGV